eukprot:TRINITY_DN740_c6_g1_i1.p1 TRINITY_DN740_c6_g1~~TRINITY_DN740_c6_g1_i1.p1  ORF type:complete len:464 (-),score=30.57 TRINITY_DN740_c6_g1_i1:103-1494(-)
MPRGTRKFHRHSRSLQDELVDQALQGVRLKSRTLKRRKQLQLEQRLTAHQTQDLNDKIMALVKEQQAEEKLEQNVRGESLQCLKVSLSEKDMTDSDDDNGFEYEYDFDGFTDVGSTIAGSDWGTQPDSKDLELDEQEVQIMSSFLKLKPQQQVDTLADFIKPFMNQEQEQKKDKRKLLLSKCKQVGEILQRYTSGKIPRMFKVLPLSDDWEELLYHMNPECWSPHAVYQATKVFISNLKTDAAQRFVNLILLPRFRQEIKDNKKVHFSIFRALRKATFKPAAFYRGLLLPLCRDGDCTVREAVTLESVLKRCSIPAEHSSVALLKLAEMPYSGTNSYFIKALVDKRYALPYVVIDALVEHFTSFEKEDRILPVVWHQSLLLFVQRYKSSIKLDDQSRIKKLLKKQRHEKICPIVEQELFTNPISRYDISTMEVDGNFSSSVVRLASVGENINDMAPVTFMDTT